MGAPPPPRFPKPDTDFRPADAGGGAEAAPPERKSVDLRATPTGNRPEAWANLPPPEIVRAEPEPKKSVGDGAKTFLHSRAAKQIGLVLVAGLVIYGVIWLYTPKSTSTSHFGSLNLFCDALEARDVAAMQSHTTGMATPICQILLDEIEELEKSGQASRFARATHNAGGAPAGSNVTSAVISCFGENGDLFLLIDTNLDRTAEGWKISAMASRPVR